MESRLNEQREAEDRLKRVKMAMKVDAETLNARAEAALREMTVLGNRDIVDRSTLSRMEELAQEYKTLAKQLEDIETHIPKFSFDVEIRELKRRVTRREEKDKIEALRLSDPSFKDFECKLDFYKKNLQSRVSEDVMRAFCARYEEVDEDEMHDLVVDLLKDDFSEAWADVGVYDVISAYNRHMDLVKEMLRIRKEVRGVCE